MQEKVAAYLEDQKRRTQEARARKLVELGLWEKEFDPGGEGDSSAYPFLEDGKYYRKVPVEVTDEEWTAICQYAGQEPPADGTKRNPVSKALYVMAMIVYIGGGLLGVGLCLYTMSVFGGSFLAVLIQVGSILVSAAIFGTVLLGLSEIIRLLDRR